MRALCCHGKQDIRCDTVPDPKAGPCRGAMVAVLLTTALDVLGGALPARDYSDRKGIRTA
jgi:hypothetical protein